jgi:hypothetical protein
VVITGADGLFDENTIPDLISVLLAVMTLVQFRRPDTIAKGESVFSNSESAYRSIYVRMCTWKARYIQLSVLTVPLLHSKRKLLLP